LHNSITVAIFGGMVTRKTWFVATKTPSDAGFSPLQTRSCKGRGLHPTPLTPYPKNCGKRLNNGQTRKN
jgi:hypothetical protein